MSDMYENRWSPFDPQWYQAAFDKFISTADQLFNTDLIKEQGYSIPDADGSKSSIFRNTAVLTNTFNEKDLRETLKTIYLNSTHKLIASNHDNVHFFKWFGHMSDMNITENIHQCEFKIPTDTFISSKERDIYKLSQYFRKWIKVEDLLNHWDVFKWHCMLFIDQKVYSEYELRMDDSETTIRFQYIDYWLDNDVPVYIYKFDTNAQCRVLVSRELFVNQWNWKMPLSYITDRRVINSPTWMIAFNKISDSTIRTDGLTKIEVLGDNLEFVKNKDGYIDFSKISDFNRIYIESETSEWLWMSIIVPKFFHEFPVLLPTDTIYRPYEADFQPVVTNEYSQIHHVKADLNDDVKTKQIYVDMNDRLGESISGWKEIIRPIVLADAFDDPDSQSFDEMLEELNNLRKLTVDGANIIEKFRLPSFMDYNDEEFGMWLDRLKDILTKIYETHNAFLDKRFIEHNAEYDEIYERSMNLIEEIREDGNGSEWLHPPRQHSDVDFWMIISPCIHIPRALADKYNILAIMSALGDNRHQWENISDSLGKLRFQRPIEENDFWTFEYYGDDKVWRPYPLKLTHHFPDVYMPEEMDITKPIGNRLFKTFFFYSDTMNVLEETNDIRRATPSWDEDMQEYYFDHGAVYRDIFMEKFYWMGVRAIYKGILVTHARWEVLEYIIDNWSYRRFNELFMQTMDPYFKLGLATYLKSENFEFPFDEAVSKMQEAITADWIGYQKINNFELYLNKTWIPSYFDYVVKIMDDWKWHDRLLRRPRATFDVDRILPIMTELAEDIFKAIRDTNYDINWIVDHLQSEKYRIDTNLMDVFRKDMQNIYDNAMSVLDFTKNLDLQIYSIADINEIIKQYQKHISLSESSRIDFDEIYANASAVNIHETKRESLNYLINHIDELPELINIVYDSITRFDIDSFMLAVNDLRGYFEHDKNNPDDSSLIGYINQFEDPWTIAVKDSRNQLFVDTTKLYGTYEPDKSYTTDEVASFIEIVHDIIDDLHNLRDIVSQYWTDMGYQEDQIVIDRIDNSETIITNFSVIIDGYGSARENLLKAIQKMKDNIDSIRLPYITKAETEIFTKIFHNFDDMISYLSYIAGENKKRDAIEKYETAKRNIFQWKTLLDEEKSVFDKIFELTSEPVRFFTTLNNHQQILAYLIEYLSTLDTEFIPDAQLPSYSDIYSVNSIEMISGGFGHNVDEIAYIPNLGSYKITSVESDVSTATGLEALNYRNTTYRNPMWQSNPFDSITNGDGVGITVKPTDVNHERIINDEIAEEYILKIKNYMRRLSDCIPISNPRNNSTCEIVIKDIESIPTDWDDTLSFYEDYMSSTIKSYMEELISILNGVIPVTNTFIAGRDLLAIGKLSDYMYQYIYGTYEYISSISGIDSNFNHYHDDIMAAYNTLCDFYGNGTSWEDLTQLKNILDEIRLPINFYKTKIIDPLEINPSVEKLLELYTSTTDEINTIYNAINNIDLLRIDVKSVINSINKKIDELPELQKDVWYKISHTNVAQDGNGYKVGDIVSIKPQLPTDNMGETIHSELDDVILNDVILLKVTEVRDGKVVKIEPLMNYAIPYLIWGVRETTTLVGNGHGMIADVYSTKLELRDSTLFLSDKSYVSKPPQFDENDMFMFKFNNIHDLDMNYEVFLAGQQIDDFVFRHENHDNYKTSRNLDVLYLNANNVIDLMNSSIFVPAEHYFVYKIDKVDIKDPGAGYCVGQDIFVDGNQIALRLEVTELLYSPFKEIGAIQIADGKLVYNGYDPTMVDGKAVTDSMNNIDDEYNEGYYDHLTKDGIDKGAVRSLDPERYKYTSTRWDKLADSMRNKTFMYPDVDMPDIENPPLNGDQEFNYYLGSRIDNSQHPMKDKRRWNGLMNLIPPTHPMIPDNRRIPTNQSPKGEYQLFGQQRFHDTTLETNTNVNVYFQFSIRNHAIVDPDLVVPTYADLPRNTDDYPEGRIGRKIIVEDDEKHDHHRMMYHIRTFIAAGFFVYDVPELADEKWNTFNVDWMNCDFYPDYPSDKAQYPTAPWHDSPTYIGVQREIVDEKHENKYSFPKVNHTSYIRDLTVDDLSVYNCTTNSWEDLHDESRWLLEVRDDSDNKDWGFKLTFLEEGTYSYDMKLYWNKLPENQIRNSELKKDAVFDVSASIIGEVDNPAINTLVNTGRHLRIRKLFPYEQKETFTIGVLERGAPPVYEMNFRLANYMHYKNEIHLEDVKIWNKTAGRFENILDPNMFEVRFKDPKCTDHSFETQTNVLQSVIGDPGLGFVDGDVWGYNSEFDIHIFGHVTADYERDGHLLTFTLDHCPNPPTEDLALEFDVYQSDSQSLRERAVVMVEFHTERVEVFGDGYIHNVTNRFAPLPKEIQIIVQYDLTEPQTYEVSICKTPTTWEYIQPRWLMAPTIYLPKVNIQQDRLYILTDKGRFPLVNPSTKKPTIHVTETGGETKVRFLNLYRRYEKLEVRSTPYPMRSVYVQRRIPSSGYINLDGRLNKPLNKKYFEFWVNGKLLHDEVTIITPTKIFLHGLKSLKNLEIIEINRDNNEYFADNYLTVKTKDYGRPYQRWNYDTYLDDALEGTLEDNNYTLEEQEYLLSPVWKQITEDHPEFKNYPPNVDIEDDVLTRVNPDDYPLENDLDDPTYQFMIIEAPTLEGEPIVSRTLSFETFGFIPISDDMIIDILNEEWVEEMKDNPYFQKHVIISDDEWYGMATRMYDEYGMLVNNLNTAAYSMTDSNILRINADKKISRIVKTNITYDLT